MSVGIMASSVVPLTPVAITGTVTSAWGTWTAHGLGEIPGKHSGLVASNWGGWTATAVGTVRDNWFATVASNWGGWTGAAIGLVNITVPATAAASWGTWNATALAQLQRNAIIDTSWGTWTATGAGHVGVGHDATIASNWGELSWFPATWWASAIGNLHMFGRVTNDWGTWTARAFGNTRPMPRVMEDEVARLYEDGSPRHLEQREYFEDHGAWTPAALSGLVLDLDAGNYTNGTTWANPGSGDDVPIYSTPLPVRVDAVINGLSVVRFSTNGGRVRMYTTGVDDDFTLVYVGRMVSGGNPVGRIVNGIYSPNNILFGFWNNFQDVAYDNGFAVPNTQTTVTTDWKLYSADGEPGLDRFFGNGVQLGTIGTAQGWGGTFAINGYDPTATSETCDCEVAKAYLWNRKLSDADRQQVEAYMRTRYALPS